jgi:GIY-YIG catalytic domain
MIVYLLLNTVNLKGYVGQHKGDKISGRWNRSMYGANPHLTAAINKYGSEAFSREILNVCSSQEEMSNLERLWIVTLRTYDPEFGYNETFGGESSIKFTPQLRKKMSELAIQRGAGKNNKGRKNSLAQRLRQSEITSNLIWITDGKSDDFVPVDSTIPEGWKRGRSTGPKKSALRRVCFYCFRAFTPTQGGEQVLCSRKCAGMVNNNILPHQHKAYASSWGKFSPETRKVNASKGGTVSAQNRRNRSSSIQR